MNASAKEARQKQKKEGAHLWKMRPFFLLLLRSVERWEDAMKCGVF